MNWSDSIKLSNGIVELEIVPSIARAVAFNFVNGANVFYTLDKHKCKTRKATEPYIGFGGLYTWLAPQRHWRLSNAQKQYNLGEPESAPFDGLLHEIIEENQYSIKLTRSDKEVYGLKMEKTYTLEKDSSRFIYDVTITNITDVVLRWSIWNLSAVNPEGKILFKAKNWDDLHVFPKADESSINAFKPYLTFVDDNAILDFSKIKAKGKKLFVKPKGNFIFQYFENKYWLLRTFPAPEKYDIFTDNNTQIAFWTDRQADGIFELETLSPDIALEPGQSYSWQEIFEIRQANDYLSLPNEIKNLRIN